jgi:hypothetical protein
MKSLLSNLFLATALLASSHAAAQPAAVIEGVQMPAWVERNEAGAAPRRIPASAGMGLKPGDTLSTGPGSRLLIKLSEGSLVKLGENGSLQLKELEPAETLFKAALGVLQGAFRFTTDALAKNRRRDINISVATVTAGIRGTDLWGKSSPDKQIVCLIEGRIEVGAPGETAVEMDQPRQFLYERLRAAGYAAEIFPELKGEKRLYAVRIRSLPSKTEAQALAAQLRGKHGVADPKVVS